MRFRRLGRWECQWENPSQGVIARGLFCRTGWMFDVRCGQQQMHQSCQGPIDPRGRQCWFTFPRKPFPTRVFLRPPRSTIDSVLPHGSAKGFSPDCTILLSAAISSPVFMTDQRVMDSPRALSIPPPPRTQYSTLSKVQRFIYV